MASYEIELLPFNLTGAGETMYRLGRKFSVREPEVIELTDEQAEVFKNDWRFKVLDSTDRGKKLETGNVATSDIVPPAADTTNTEETVASETETVSDSDLTPEEEAGLKDEGTFNIEDLLKDNSREELNAQATKLGIENPEDFDNKTEVAQAIVDAR